MPWTAELMNKKISANGGAEFQVDFYDDERLEETKTTQVFNWLPGTTANQAKQDVVARGQEIKGKYTLFDQLKVGSKVPIP